MSLYKCKASRNASRITSDVFLITRVYLLIIQINHRHHSEILIKTLLINSIEPNNLYVFNENSRGRLSVDDIETSAGRRRRQTGKLTPAA